MKVKRQRAVIPMQTKLSAVKRSNGHGLLESTPNEVGVGKLTLKIGGGELNTSRMSLHSEYLASASSRTTLKKRKLEMVDDALLGVVYSGKMAGYARPWPRTQRRGLGSTSKNSEWVYIYMF